MFSFFNLFGKIFNILKSKSEPQSMYLLKKIGSFLDPIVFTEIFINLSKKIPPPPPKKDSLDNEFMFTKLMTLSMSIHQKSRKGLELRSSCYFFIKNIDQNCTKLGINYGKIGKRV